MDDEAADALVDEGDEEEEEEEERHSLEGAEREDWPEEGEAHDGGFVEGDDDEDAEGAELFAIDDPLEALASSGRWRAEHEPALEDLEGADDLCVAEDETSQKLRRMAELLDEAELRETLEAREGEDAGPSSNIVALAEQHAKLLEMHDELERLTPAAADVEAEALRGPSSIAALAEQQAKLLEMQEELEREAGGAAAEAEAEAEAEAAADAADEAMDDVARAPQEPPPAADPALEAHPVDPAEAEAAGVEAPSSGPPSPSGGAAAVSEAEAEMRARYLALLEAAADQRLALNRTLAEIGQLEAALGLATEKVNGCAAPRKAPVRLAAPDLGVETLPPPPKRPRVTATKAAAKTVAKSSAFAPP